MWSRRRILGRNPNRITRDVSSPQKGGVDPAVMGGLYRLVP